MNRTQHVDLAALSSLTFSLRAPELLLDPFAWTDPAQLKELHHACLRREVTGLYEDEPDRLWDLFWSDHDPIGQPVKVLKGIAEFFLVPEMSSTRLMTPEEFRYRRGAGARLGDPARHWFRLTRMIPEELLKVAIWKDGATAPSAGLDSRVLFSDSLTDKIALSVGDLHLHLGAARRFRDLAFAIPPCTWQRWIAWSTKRKCDDVWDRLPFTGRIKSSWWIQWLHGFLAGALLDRQKPASGLAIAQLGQYWQRLVDVVFPVDDELARPSPGDYNMKSDVESILNAFKLPGPLASPEDSIRALCAADVFDLLDCDDLFCWNWVRTRVLLYSLVVQPADLPGLGNFSRYKGYSRPMESAMGKREVSDAVEAAGGGRLAYVELRLTFPDGTRKKSRLGGSSNEKLSVESQIRSDLEKNLEECIRQTQDYQREETNKDRNPVPVCFSLSLQKKNHGGSDAQKKGGQVRHFQALNLYRMQLRALIDYWQRKPEARLCCFRGIDVCSQEMGMPNWPFALIYHALLDMITWQDPQTRPLYRPENHLSPIRNTFHAGEDYLWPVQGVRLVQECVDPQHGFLRPWDRIGHGVALGENLAGGYPGRGREIHGYRGDLMDDLVWAWGMLERSAPVERAWSQLVREDPGVWAGLDRGATITSWRQWTEKMIDDWQADLDKPQVQKFKHSSATPGQLYKAYRMRFDYEKMKRWGWISAIYSGAATNQWLGSEAITKTKYNQGGDDVVGLLLEYMTSPPLWKAWYQPYTLWLERYFPSGEDRWMQLLQRLCRNDVRDRKVAVECCPSSNLGISPVDEQYMKHPIFSFVAVNGDWASPEDLPAMVCSDNPLYFETDVVNEYRHLEKAAALRGFTIPQTVDWLRRIADYANLYKFHCQPRGRSSGSSGQANPSDRCAEG